MGLEKIDENMINEAMDNQRMKGDIVPCDTIETGFIDLDYRLNGLRPGEIYLLAGRPGMGTTSFALNLIKDLSVDRSKETAYFSLDRSREQIIRMLVQIISEAEYQDVLTGVNYVKSVIEAEETLSFAKIYIEDTPHMSALEIITSLLESHDYIDMIDFIVIDYLELLDIADEGELEKAIRCIKVLAESSSSIVFILSRLEEAPDHRESHIPIMEDLKWPAMERLVDNVIFLYRDERYNPDSEMAGIAEFIIARNKHAEEGVVRLGWMPEHLKFCNLGCAKRDDELETNAGKENKDQEELS